MVMRPGPLVEALAAAEARGPVHKVLLSPVGRTLDRDVVARLASCPRLALVCARYEGYDERVVEFVDEELSIGDYVLSGGELAALVIIDAVARRLEGVLGNAATVVEESFEGELPRAPAVHQAAGLPRAAGRRTSSSGDHAAIARWRRTEALQRTRTRRPDLFATLELSQADRIALGLEAPPVKRRRSGEEERMSADPPRPTSRSSTTPCTTRPARSSPPRSPTSICTTSRAAAAPPYGVGAYFIVHPVPGPAARSLRAHRRRTGTRTAATTSAARRSTACAWWPR